MLFLYNLGIFLLRLVYNVASLFDAKAKAFNAGRKNLLEKIRSELSENSHPVVWIHTASLGEFEQARPVMERIKREFANHKILLTFFSPSGYEVRKKYDQADYIYYLPWDTRGNASSFINATKPVLAIFIKYEFWNHYIHQLKKRNIPTLSVSSIFRNDQLFFRSYGGFFRKMLHKFTYFFVQNDESVRLLKSIQLNNCTRAGDTRFDRVYEVVQRKEEIEIAKQFKGQDKTMVIGSCWPEDLELFIPFINENYHFLKFIIAPHELSESFITGLEKALSATTVRFSKATPNTVSNAHVLIIDNIGMLNKLYRYGEFAYVGGAFGKGLHNILEAACYGIPVFFGNKNYKKFQEAVDLINRGGAFEVADYRDLKEKYEMITLPENFLLACEVTRQYVEENLGATDKIMEYCKKLLRA
jgi:3-deoxy-D-manno-octulosonic-acid transferase